MIFPLTRRETKMLYHYPGECYSYIGMKNIENINTDSVWLEQIINSNIFSDRKGVMRLASLSLVNLAPTVSNSPIPTDKWHSGRYVFLMAC